MKIEICTNPTRRKNDGLAAISVRAPGQSDYDLDLPFKGLYRRFGIPDTLSLDFLIVASLCYVIDKTISRSTAPDNWTREIEVEFPVSDPAMWQKTIPDLEAALCFLTGDVWQLSFRKSDVAFFKPPRRKRRSRRRSSVPSIGRPTAACLFSGGLDSLIGAINLLNEDKGQRLFLIGHYDSPGPRSQQEALFTQIRTLYPLRAELQQTRASHTPEAAQELTLRSRSLVFIALGIYAARFGGKDVPLFAPENGMIAINIPLTPSRAGSCSTRTMHPFYLEKLRSVLRSIGINNPLINRLQEKTKGECVLECLDQTFLQTLIPFSVSCSHGARKQHWIRKDANNCGYCVPCIYRRASLHKAGFDDGQQYGIDICAGEMLIPIDDDKESADDLRAMLDFLRQRKSLDKISRAIRCIAPVNNVEALAAMIERGFDEVRQLIRDKSTHEIKQAAGVSDLSK